MKEQPDNVTVRKAQEDDLPSIFEMESEPEGYKEQLVVVHHPVSIPLAVAEVLTGAAAGVMAGAIAGPAGAVVGAVIGTLAGVTAELVLERDAAKQAQHEAELDAQIGVVGGHIGEARRDAPPQLIGAFSAAAMGISGAGTTPAGGPIQGVGEA